MNPRKKKLKPFKMPFRGKIQYGGPEKPNKPKSEKIVTPREFAQNAERDARIDRERALEQGARIFLEWRKQFVKQSRTLEDVVGQIDQLKAQLEEIKSDGIDFVIGHILNPVLADLAQKFVFDQFAEKVVVSCPHQVIRNGAPADCGWGGIAMFHKGLWSQGRASMECPQCHSEIKQDGEHMMLAEEAKKLWESLEKKTKKQKE